MRLQFSDSVFIMLCRASFHAICPVLFQYMGLGKVFKFTTQKDQRKLKLFKMCSLMSNTKLSIM